MKTDLDPVSPYPGLRPFEADEAHLFFGRDEQSDELLRRLRTRRFLAIVGTSGCGKSSLVKAGLLPGLHGGFMVTAGSAWRVATMRPGGDPIGNLARALNSKDVFGTDTTGEGQLSVGDFTETTLRRGPLGLVEATSHLWQSSDGNLLVLVDQFEEIFRFATPATPSREDDAAAFVKLLLEAVHQDAFPIYVVLTMRSDFLGHCTRFRGLAEAINDGQYLVPRLTRDQLREAIEGPAAVGGGSVTPRLVQTLLAEIGDDQDRLPLLQHALMRSWNLRSTPDAIDLPGYAATGGMANALSNHANEIYQSLDARGRVICRKLFQRLTERGEPGGGTRRPTRISEICEVVQAPLENVVAVVDAFRAPGCSFLMPPHGVPLTPDSMLDVSHESLMRQWDELRKWTEDEYKAAEQYLRLSEAATLFEDGKTSLWRNPELDIGLAWKQEQRPTAPWAKRYAGDFDRAMTFLDKSKRKRWGFRIGFGIAVLVAVIAGTAFFQVRRAASASLREAHFAAAGSVSDPLTKALLLAEMGTHPAEPERQRYLRLYQEAAAAAIPRAVMGRLDPNNAMIAVRFGADGRLVTGDVSGTLRSWPSDGRGDSKNVSLRQDGNAAGAASGDYELVRLRGLSFSLDQQWIAAAFRDGTIVWGRTDGLRDLPRLPYAYARGPAHSPYALALNPAGTQLAIGFSDNSVEIWTRDAVGSFAMSHVLRNFHGFISGLDFDPAGDRLVTASADGKVRVWKLDGHEPSLLVMLPPELQVQTERDIPAIPNSAKFSPDGKWIVSGYSDNVARIWNSETSGPPPLVLRGHAGQVTSAAFSPSAGAASYVRVGTTSIDRTARVWTLRQDPVTGLQVIGSPTLLLGHLGTINALAFSADGSQVATGSADGTTRVWPTEPKEPRILGYHAKGVESVAFNSDGKLLVTGSRDTTAQVWVVRESAKPAPLLGHQDWVRSAVFSPVDDKLVATVSFDGVLGIWDVTTGKHEFSPISKHQLFAVAFSPDGARVATASEDKQATIWKLDHFKVRDPIFLDKHEDWVMDVAFSPDGKQVVTASNDGAARLWSAAGALQQLFAVRTIGPPLSVDDARVRKAAFSPDGGRIATASAETVRLWRLDGSQDRLVIRHNNDVVALAFHPDAGRWLLTASQDGTARLWDSHSGNEVLNLPHGAQVHAAAFDANGRYVATGDEDGLVRLWLIDPSDLAAYFPSATTACLSPSDRAKFLGEPDQEANLAYEACERRNGRSPR